MIYYNQPIKERVDTNGATEGRLSKKRQEKYFSLAKNVSSLSDFHGRYHLGAVIVYKGRIISDGYNVMKTTPVQKEYNKFRNFKESYKNDGATHAEMMALLRSKEVDIEWDKASVFVYREHKNGTKALAMPCKACMQAIKDRGIRNVYFTAEGGFGYIKLD